LLNILDSRRKTLRLRPGSKSRQGKTSCLRGALPEYVVWVERSETHHMTFHSIA
jgi:hypothetical protein